MFDIFQLKPPVHMIWSWPPKKHVNIIHIWNMVNKTRNRFTINIINVIFAHTHAIHTMVDLSELQYHVYTIQFTGMVTGK